MNTDMDIWLGRIFCSLWSDEVAQQAKKICPSYTINF